MEMFRADATLNRRANDHDPDKRQYLEAAPSLQPMFRKGRSTMTSYCGAALRRVLGATAVAASLAVPNLASAQDETFHLAGVLGVPPGGTPLVAFDISWVDTSINLYFLADRTHKQIDVIPIDATPTVLTIKPTGSDRNDVNLLMSSIG